MFSFYEISECWVTLQRGCYLSCAEINICQGAFRRSRRRVIPASQAVPANHLEKALFSVTLLAVGTEYSCRPPSHRITADNPQHHSQSISHTPESSRAQSSPCPSTSSSAQDLVRSLHVVSDTPPPSPSRDTSDTGREEPSRSLLVAIWTTLRREQVSFCMLYFTLQQDQ